MGVFFPGCNIAVVCGDSDCPLAGRAKNARCIGVGIVLQ